MAMSKETALQLLKFCLESTEKRGLAMMRGIQGKFNKAFLEAIRLGQKLWSGRSRGKARGDTMANYIIRTITVDQWVGIIATVVICGSSLIFCKKKVPEIFGGYKWLVLTGGIIWLALFAYAWPHFDF